ncbi:MAG: sugar phosphate isomerase/epimerase [Kiritimatiellae bacterium]|nr:sugar phosphate isomerase/epimerase [Kiritimatiellia bacterium]
MDIAANHSISFNLTARIQPERKKKFFKHKTMNTTPSVKYPRIYLAIDNCFAAKRWTTPRRWLKMARKIGLSYVEASADNECDPLYMDQQYLDDWIDQVKHWQDQTGVKVINLYSGHGTYATLGLAHPDPRIRERIHSEWLEKMVKMAGKIDAGLGFFCHAFSQSLLQEPDRYYAACEELYNRMGRLADTAVDAGAKAIGVEQMYTPHQIPWTIQGASRLLSQVHKRTQRPFYLTIDTGHQTGQRKFLRPSYEQIKEAIGQFHQTGRVDGFWIGPRTAHLKFKELARADDTCRNSVDQILEEMDKYPYLFARDEDGDLYEWLGRIGCYSPIIHLQQTPGNVSSHLPFDAKNNARGIIKGHKVLQALAKSYDTDFTPEMPCPARDVYLTLEIFAGTAELPVDIINKLKDSVAYWRQFIPEDGLRLDQLL